MMWKELRGKQLGRLERINKENKEEEKVGRMMKKKVEDKGQSAEKKRKVRDGKSVKR